MEKTTPMDLLEQAENKITTKMLDTMENGETIILNERFELYKYYDDDYFVLNDKKYNDETLCVQYGHKDSVILTDFYGYDDDEDFTNLNK
tara:strand:+ start:1884 stop:2153 length:270 start_codon:yes stop_codon:yes gene_type:complete